MAAAQRDLPVLDEKLYLQVFAAPATQHPPPPDDEQLPLPLAPPF
jgi:hypothetical protein